MSQTEPDASYWSAVDRPDLAQNPGTPFALPADEGPLFGRDDDYDPRARGETPQRLRLLFDGPDGLETHAFQLFPGEMGGGAMLELATVQFDRSSISGQGTRAMLAMLRVLTDCLADDDGVPRSWQGRYKRTPVLDAEGRPVPALDGEQVTERVVPATWVDWHGRDRTDPLVLTAEDMSSRRRFLTLVGSRDYKIAMTALYDACSYALSRAAPGVPPTTRLRSEPGRPEGQSEPG